MKPYLSILSILYMFAIISCSTKEKNNTTKLNSSQSNELDSLLRYNCIDDQEAELIVNEKISFHSIRNLQEQKISTKEFKFTIEDLKRIENLGLEITRVAEAEILELMEKRKPTTVIDEYGSNNPSDKQQFVSRRRDEAETYEIYEIKNYDATPPRTTREFSFLNAGYHGEKINNSVDTQRFYKNRLYGFNLDKCKLMTLNCTCKEYFIANNQIAHLKYALDSTLVEEVYYSFPTASNNNCLQNFPILEHYKGQWGEFFYTSSIGYFEDGSYVRQIYERSNKTEFDKEPITFLSQTTKGKYFNNFSEYIEAETINYYENGKMKDRYYCQSCELNGEKGTDVVEEFYGTGQIKHRVISENGNLKSDLWYDLSGNEGSTPQNL